jgi:hypothetical protein
MPEKMYAGEEDSDRHGSTAWCWCGSGRGIPEGGLHRGSRPGIHAITPESTIGYRRFHRGFWIGEPTGERSEQAQQVDQDLGMHSVKWADCWHQVVA